jgi:hypothetical protein
LADYKAFAFYTNNGIGLTGLSITCDVYTSAGVKVADNLSATELAGGFYTYTYTGVDNDYLFVFKSNSSLADQKQLPVLYGDRSLLPEDILNLEDSVETNYSLKQILRLISSIVAGKLSGADTPHVIFRDVNDTKNRVLATVDGVGNRIEVTPDVS